MFLFAQKDAVVEVGNTYTKLTYVIIPGGGHGDWQVTFTCNADGHADDGAVDANIELFVNGVGVVDYKSYMELKSHWVAAQAGVGSPVGSLNLTYVLTGLNTMDEVAVYGQATNPVEVPYDTGGIDFFTINLVLIKLK